MIEAGSGYKLLRIDRDGNLHPLFINRKQIIEPGTWLDAEDHPTKGYAHRPGWHLTMVPYAPHLTMRGRVWCRVGWQQGVYIERPPRQGGRWVLAQRMRVVRPVWSNEVSAIINQLR